VNLVVTTVLWVTTYWLEIGVGMFTIYGVMCFQSFFVAVHLRISRTPISPPCARSNAALYSALCQPCISAEGFQDTFPALEKIASRALFSIKILKDTVLALLISSPSPCPLRQIVNRILPFSRSGVTSHRRKRPLNTY